MGAVNIMRMFYILSCVYLLLIACEKKYQTELQTIPTSGVITLKSEGDNNQSIGFSFSTASIVSIPNHHDVIPDFMLLVQLSSQSEVIGVFFSAPVIRSAFYLISQVSTADSAVAIFDNLTEVPDITYQDPHCRSKHIRSGL